MEEGKEIVRKGNKGLNGKVAWISIMDERKKELRQSAGERGERRIFFLSKGDGGMMCQRVLYKKRRERKYSSLAKFDALLHARAHPRTRARTVLRSNLAYIINE